LANSTFALFAIQHAACVRERHVFGTGCAAGDRRRSRGSDCTSLYYQPAHSDGIPRLSDTGSPNKHCLCHSRSRRTRELRRLLPTVNRPPAKRLQLQRERGPSWAQSHAIVEAHQLPKGAEMDFCAVRRTVMLRAASFGKTSSQRRPSPRDNIAQTDSSSLLNMSAFSIRPYLPRPLRMSDRRPMARTSPALALVASGPRSGQPSSQCRFRTRPIENNGGRYVFF